MEKCDGTGHREANHAQALQAQCLVRRDVQCTRAKSDATARHRSKFACMPDT